MSKGNEFEFTHVHHSSKRGFWPMFVIMLGFSFFSASMWAGGNLGVSLATDKFLLAVLSGNLLLGMYTGILAFIASRTSLSTHLLAHYSFGSRGSYLPSFLLAITQVGWFGVGIAMFAFPVQKIFEQFNFFIINPTVNLYIIVWVSGIIMTVTAWFGIRALAILGVIAVPSIAVLGFVSVGKCFSEFGVEAWWNAMPSGSMTLTTAIGICIATFISGGTLTPDFTRFSKNAKIAVSTTMIAFFLGNSLMFFFGAVGASFYNLSDISDVMMKQGMIVWAIIVLGLNIWTTNENAIYASGLGFANITKLPNRYFVLINGTLGTAFAVYLFNNFVSWLVLLNTMLPSIGGVIIADYFFVKKGNYRLMSEHSFEGIRWTAIVAWGSGVLAAKYGPGISSVNSVIASIVIYTVLEKTLQKIVILKSRKDTV